LPGIGEEAGGAGDDRTRTIALCMGRAIRPHRRETALKNHA
jgi:hypothetical protein